MAINHLLGGASARDEPEHARIRALGERGRHLHQQGHPEAIAVLREAIAAFERAGLEDDPFLAPLRNTLGLALKDCGELAEARELFTRAHAYFERCHDESHPDYATTLHNFVATQMQASEGAVCWLPQMQRVLDLYARYGNRPEDIANTCNVVAIELARLGRHAEARGYFERALRECERADVRGGETCASIWHQLAGTLHALGDVPAFHAADRAGTRAYFHLALPVAAWLAPLAHASAVNLLERAHVELTLYDGYAECSKRSVALAAGLCGAGGPLANEPAVLAIAACVDVELVPDRVADAVDALVPGWSMTDHGAPIVRELFDAQLEHYFDVPSGPRIEEMVALIESVVGRHDWMEYFTVDRAKASEPNWAESDEQPSDLEAGALDYREDRRASGDPSEAAHVLARLQERTARNRARQALYDDAVIAADAAHDRDPRAEGQLRDVIARFATLAPKRDWGATLWRLLGSLLRDQGRTDEAIDWCERAHDWFARRYGERQQDTRLAAFDLALALLAADRLDEAVMRLQDLLLVTKRVRGDDHEEVAGLRSWLGEAYRRRGELERARDQFEYALAIRERGEQPERTASVLQSLARIHEALDEPQQANAYLERAAAILFHLRHGRGDAR